MSPAPCLLQLLLPLLAGGIAYSFLWPRNVAQQRAAPRHIQLSSMRTTITTILRATTTPDGSSRRAWMANVTTASAALAFGGAQLGLFSLREDAEAAVSDESFQNPDVPPSDDLYDNPNIPQAPEEKSGLVVLRVAEVCEFQEKILRAVAMGELEDVVVSPQQIAFGTQILLKNSNLDGNLKLMIYNEVPRAARERAIRNAVDTMNGIQDILVYSANIQRPFKQEELIELADMYRSVKIQLNQLYEYLPDREKDKYYGYFVAVTEYEKKIANGTYNPDLDGVLQLDYE